jgi:hypothetical protein
MSRPPSQAVIEAVEQAARALHPVVHVRRFECVCGAPMKDGTAEAHDAHRRFEVARAAEAAALGAIAGDWLIERTYGLSDEGIRGGQKSTPTPTDAPSRTHSRPCGERADELTDETGEQ